MKITALTVQQRDPNRVNVMVDGKYRFSLDITQVGDLGMKVGNEYSDKELAELETESQFGKLYARALEYCLLRPHSAREMKDYLYRKTLTKKYKSKQTGELKERVGVSQSVADRVFTRLIERGYIDDERFAHYWVENRHQTKGTSRRKLKAELAAKGVDRVIIERALGESERSDEQELRKIIAKKRSRYPDEQKFMQYLARQGFSYDDIKSALSEDSDSTTT
jgi:regulatory protein